MAHGDIVKDADMGKDADLPGLGETETLPDGAITEGDAIPEMPPGSDRNDVARPGGGLTADDMATGLTALRE